MKPPKWAKVIGILGVILAISGVSSGYGLITVPAVQKQVQAEIEKNFPDMDKLPEEIKQKLQAAKSLTEVKDWYVIWAYIGGSLGLAISPFYGFASIWLFLTRSSALKFFYIASVVDIFYMIIRAIASILGTPAVGLLALIPNFIGILFVTILLIVVVSNKSTYSDRLENQS